MTPHHEPHIGSNRATEPQVSGRTPVTHRPLWMWAGMRLGRWLWRGASGAVFMMAGAALSAQLSSRPGTGTAIAQTNLTLAPTPAPTPPASTPTPVPPSITSLPPALKDALTQLGSSNSQASYRAEQTLREAGAPAVVPALGDLIRTGSARQREGAGRILGFCGRAGVDALLELLRSTDIETRRLGARGLGNGSGTLHNALFLELLRDEAGPGVPPAEFDTIRKSGRFLSFSTIHSGDERVQAVARKADFEIQRELMIEPAIRALIEAVGDADAQVREAAQTTLEQNFTGQRLGPDREAWRAWFAKLDPAWGEPSEGARARVRSIQWPPRDRTMGDPEQIWSDANPPVIRLDLRNDGPSALSFINSLEWVTVEVDGQPFQGAGNMGRVEVISLAAGAQVNAIRLILDQRWTRSGAPLRWSPGVHTVALAATLWPAAGEGHPLKLRTNPMPVSILAGAPYAKGGLKFEAGFVPDRTEALLGEEITVTYFIRNTGTKDFNLIEGGDYRGAWHPDHLRISAVDEDGKPVVDPHPNSMSMGGLGGPITIVPGLGHTETQALSACCAFTRPGVYTVNCRNLRYPGEKDVWGPPGVRDEKSPVRDVIATSFTLTLREPGAAEARRVFEERQAEAKKSSYSTALESLYAPIYLAPLLEDARKGNGEAIRAIGGMETPEATRALLDLGRERLDDKQTTPALAALGQLRSRLPDPASTRHDARIDSATLEKYYAPQRERVARCWRPELAVPALALAHRLAASADPGALELAGFIFYCLGAPADLPAVLDGYTRAFEAVKAHAAVAAKDYPANFPYLHARDALNGFRRAVPEILKRGAAPPADPSTPGEAAAYMIALHERPDFRPPAWIARAVGWLEGGLPSLRECVLENLPDPPPEAVLAELPGLLAVDDPYLQGVACRMAGKHPQPAFKEPLLKVLRSGRNASPSGMLDAAEEAAMANDIPNDQMMDVWADRLDPADLGPDALIHLARGVLGHIGGWGAQTPSPETLRELQPRWRAFIDKNRKQLHEGRPFRPGDPALPADLFPVGYSFDLGSSPPVREQPVKKTLHNLPQ